MRRALRLLSLMVLAAAACAPVAATNHHREFTANGGLVFDAVIEAPAYAPADAWGVLMIGGGFGNDLDWTTPGSIVIDGQETRTSITGESHADAPLISDALVRRGFVVMRWSTIARTDPLADQWPVRATPRTLAELTEQGVAALTELRRSGLVADDRVILLGHSLGAARACTIGASDPGVAGLVLLSPAYFTRSDRHPSSFDEQGMRVGAEALRDRSLPCLTIFGGLDRSRAVDAGAAQAFGATGAAPDLSVLVLPDVGHNLGPEAEGRFGPIDPRVVGAIADWATDLARSGSVAP